MHPNKMGCRLGFSQDRYSVSGDKAIFLSIGSQALPACIKVYRPMDKNLRNDPG